MKHLILLSIFALNSSLFTLSASLPQRWDVDLSAQPPQVFTLQRPRGETYEIEAVLKNHGKPFEPAITNAFIYWQTNGMANLYWSAPASVSNNVIRATWLPSMDPGATTARGYIGDPGHIYAVAFQFRFISSPGALPNELPLPQKVIDFAKVTVLNPPWSGGGGGGGVDTNAVIDIVHKTVAGSARALPPYLHYLEMDDTYPDAAAEWYAQADYSHGSCSSVRDGNTLSRNYDWNFNFMPEFVVRVPSGQGRFASLAVCNVGTNLTEADVISGKWSKWYKALPGHAVDGINENGVACNINVVSGSPSWGGGVSPALHPRAAVRWILDNATNAQHAAEYIATHIAFPSGLTQNFHYMIADEHETWIVENGSAHPVPSRPSATGDEQPVLTNFRIYPYRDTTGEGQERYDALVSGENITSQWWTLTYTPGGYRASDLPGITGDDLNQLFNYWENNPRESHRGETIGDQSWWQTVHTSVYDISNRVLRICVQEKDDWYTFAVDQANVDLSRIAAQIAALQDGKRDKSDLNVYDFTDWDVEFIGVQPPAGFVEAVRSRAMPYWDPRDEETGNGWEIPSLELEGEWFDTKHAGWQHDEDGTSVRIEAGFTNYDDINYDCVFIRRASSTVVDKIAKKSEVDANRDRDDNTCHKTEFGKFVHGQLPDGVTFDINPQPEHHEFGLIWYDDIAEDWVGHDQNDGTWIFYHFGDTSGLQGSFTATRSAVCTDGKKFVTDDVVDSKVSAAVSTNNPEFVSAVRNTPTSGMPEDMPTDWGTYGTVGAALAALAAFVKWAKAKIVAVIGDDGKPSDTFATDLLGKQVANAKVRYALATTASAAMADRTVNLYEMNGNGTITFPTATTHEGVAYARDFLLRVKVTTAGSLTLPTDVTPLGDSFDFTKANDWLIAFTEIGKDANNKAEFYIRAISLEV